MPALWKRLEGLGSTSSRALRFTILTAARTGETIGGTWDEVDLEAETWTIPAERMKAGVEHVVPLTDEAVALLGPAKRTGYLFPGARPKRPLSNMAMLEVVRGIRDDGATVHGMRAAFRTWAADAGHPREVAEACLAHAVGNAVEQAYQRSSYLTRRRAVLEDWAGYLAS
jgi:integrase